MNPMALLVLRIALGVIFIAHGGQKVLGWWDGKGLDAFVTQVQSMGMPAFLGYGAAFVELIGGLLVFVGLLTRFAAFSIFVVMVVATVQVHWDHGFFLQNKGFEYNFSLIGISLALMFGGAGEWSIDRAFQRR